MCLTFKHVQTHACMQTIAVLDRLHMIVSKIASVRLPTSLQHPFTQLVDLLKLGQDPLVLLSLNKLATLGGGQKLAWLGASTDHHQSGEEEGDVNLVHFLFCTTGGSAQQSRLCTKRPQ